MFFNSAIIFALHGGDPYLTTYTGGKVVRNINLPPMRDAVQIYRQLFRDGLLDPEFATHSSQAYFQKLQMYRVATETNTIDQLVPAMSTVVPSGMEKVFAPPLKQYPPGVDPDLIRRQNNAPWPIAGNYTAISAKTLHPAESWKVLEGFASDELREALVWGRAGKEHNVVDGRRVPTDRLFFHDTNDADSHYWTLHLGIFWGFWPTEAKYALQRQKNPEMFERCYASSRWLVEAAEANGPGWGNYLPQEVLWYAYAKEREAELSTILANTISWQWTMERYDEELAAWNRRHQGTVETWTTWIREHRGEMISKGWKGADW